MVLRRCPLSDLPPTTRVDASGPAASRVPNDPEDVIILNKRYMAESGTRSGRTFCQCYQEQV